MLITRTYHLKKREREKAISSGHVLYFSTFSPLNFKMANRFIF